MEEEPVEHPGARHCHHRRSGRYRRGDGRGATTHLSRGPALILPVMAPYGGREAPASSQRVKAARALTKGFPPRVALRRREAAR
jgi:hypothetical protein